MIDQLQYVQTADILRTYLYLFWRKIYYYELFLHLPMMIVYMQLII